MRQEALPAQYTPPSARNVTVRTANGLCMAPPLWCSLGVRDRGETKHQGATPHPLLCDESPPFSNGVQNLDVAILSDLGTSGQAA